jgi:hypothetical protein
LPYARGSLDFGLSPEYPHFLQLVALMGLRALQRMQTLTLNRRFSATSNFAIHSPLPPNFFENFR